MEAPVSELRHWWLKRAQEDVDMFLRKFEEYGSVDLEIMGDAMVAQGVAGESYGEVAAIMFYALGKIARAISALNNGKLPSEDTMKDLVIYSMMARIRVEAHNKS